MGEVHEDADEKTRRAERVGRGCERGLIETGCQQWLHDFDAGIDQWMQDVVRRYSLWYCRQEGSRIKFQALPQGAGLLKTLYDQGFQCRGLHTEGVTGFPQQ